VPSTMVESMGPAGYMAAAALAGQQQQEARAAAALNPAPADDAAVHVAEDFKLFSTDGG
jgi:hypothetical protein